MPDISEETLRKLLKEHREAVGQKERSGLSQDVLVMLPLGRPYPTTHEAVLSKFQGLLKELEGKKFENEARCLDVFVLGREYGSQLEMVGNLAYAKTLYKGALQVARNSAGKKALARVYGKRCNEGILLQYLGLLSKKQRRLKKAEEYYLEALEVPGVTLALMDTVIHQLHMLYMNTGDIVKVKNTHKRKIDKAYDCLQRGYSIACKVREPNYAESTSGNPTAAFLGHPAYRTVKQQHLQAHMLAFMGRIRFHQGRDQEALPFFERAFSMPYEQQNPDMAVYMNDYGRIDTAIECVAAARKSARSNVFSDIGRQTTGDVVRPDFNITCGACAKTEAEGTKFKVCSKCKRVKYCSAECQKNDWKAHKKICRPLPV
ncbi:hypothetical protein KFL_008930040 [Klebsormidium nitens]|uniref:MYND-type domain-containing protein n=1 Tax=Klebsormidium nitens TaxID=105231 RepID=A0A1Y1IUQ2_KLENI|nr:hypothetical protein KFL_008930040 [Klebsormidium nitens]|eukprot:GAQ91968.1 hypothetical protein KFL_008930040 [Klebsormidium nitens]